MLFSELQRVQERFRYLLEPLSPSFEALLRQCGFPLDWDNFPLYNLSSTSDISKLDQLSNTFWLIETDWKDAVAKAKESAIKVNPFKTL